MSNLPPQRLAILGSTGSVGCSTLDVVALHPQGFEVVALSAQRRMDDLHRQCLRWNPRWAVVGRDEDAAPLAAGLRSAGLRTEVLAGPAGLERVASHPDVDAVMAAIVGAAGLGACLAAAAAGKRLLLANKEALVVGGALFIDTVRRGGATLLPIDSEHSAIFQCLPAQRTAWPQHVDHIVLTASGGPFRSRRPSELHEVTPDQACAHPNWVMGRKISVDSATMMNKALEVIEARWLFDLPPERIRVVIHPQSIVHSMVVCRDGSVLAQLGTPDMKVPIAYGLSHPLRIESGAERLNFETLGALSFEPADHERYPALALAYRALAMPAGATTVLNAANEVAVELFLAGGLRFTDIARVNEATLDDEYIELPAAAQTLQGLLALDRRAREAAAAHARRWAR